MVGTYILRASTRLCTMYIPLIFVLLSRTIYKMIKKSLGKIKSVKPVPFQKALNNRANYSNLADV